MTFSEWMWKENGIRVTKTQMPLPSFYTAYRKYCEENGIEPDWYN